MTSNGERRNGFDAPRMADIQERGHGYEHDYESGSPHSRHSSLRNDIISKIQVLVSEQFTAHGSCRVLEIGAGHGTFTDHVACMGAEVTVTEMSRPSLEVLRRRFEWNPRVRLLYDPDGDGVFAEARHYDVVLCVSVLHHIPDYVRFVEKLVTLIGEGGAFASFQDPLWYPRRRRLNRLVDRGAFYAWRLFQGNWWRGIKSFTRRTRGRYDIDNPSDMVEYHVLRSGVDETRLVRLLCANFSKVEQWRYWSTQLPALQAIGSALGIDTTFGILARGRSVV